MLHVTGEDAIERQWSRGHATFHVFFRDRGSASAIKPFGVPEDSTGRWGSISGWEGPWIGTTVRNAMRSPLCSVATSTDWTSWCGGTRFLLSASLSASRATGQRRRMSSRRRSSPPSRASASSTRAARSPRGSTASSSTMRSRLSAASDPCACPRARFGALADRDNAAFDPEAASLRRDMQGEIIAAIQTLPPPQRAAVILRYYLDMDEAAIAAILGCPRGTVKWRLYAARQRLRPALTAFSPEGGA